MASNVLTAESDSRDFSLLRERGASSVIASNLLTAESDSTDFSLLREPGGSSLSTPRQLYEKHRSSCVLNSGQRQLIMNAYVEMRYTNPVLIVDEACMAVGKLLGGGVGSVHEIRKETKAADKLHGPLAILSTPSRKRVASVGKRRRTARYGDFVLCALISSVHRFFRRNEIPTVEKITVEFCASPELSSLHAWTVRRRLRDIGFRREKRGRNLPMIEREGLAVWQQKCLRNIAPLRQEQTFYLDETCVTAGNTVSMVWVDTTVTTSHQAFMWSLTTGLKQMSEKGQRLSITHIDCEKGFVSGCLDVFRGRKTGEYHEELDGNRFEKWFDQVLEKLPAGSVVVMDHAPYHSRRLETVPPTGSRKEVIQHWLTSKAIPFGAKMTKKQLLDIGAPVKPQFLKYRVDDAAEKAGCIVVRLPPYRCEFNPIEFVWAQIKIGVAAQNTTFKITEIETLLNEEAAKVTHENWSSAVRHVVEVEENFKQGGATSAHIQPIVIALNGGDTSSESDLSGVEHLDEA